MLRVLSAPLSQTFRLDHLAAGAWLAGEEVAWLQGSGPREISENSIVAFGAPRAVVETIDKDPFPELERAILQKIDAGSVTSAFRGGAIGYLTYECGRFIEKFETAAHRIFELPECRFYFPYTWVARRGDEEPHVFCIYDGDARATARFLEKARTDALRLELLGSDYLLRIQKTPPRKRSTRVETPWSRDRYLLSAAWLREQIAAGEIYQANLSQPFLCMDAGDPFFVYLKLLDKNPTPFSAFLGFGNYAIVSASPELFLRKRGSRVETRPIKGTRARGATPQADAAALADLDISEKDRAELAMIVDLERNDLSRVCEPGTVKVIEARRLEAYATVHHAAAVVEGRIAPNTTITDLLKATFPGGSITGCPKIRAMSLLHDIEREPRGASFGTIGWIGHDGDLDLNIAIRTASFARDADASGGPRWNCSFRAGGGIVADSDPRAEYVESLAKARALARALGDDAFEKRYESEFANVL